MQRKDCKNIYICIKYFDFLASYRFAAAFFAIFAEALRILAMCKD